MRNNLLTPINNLLTPINNPLTLLKRHAATYSECSEGEDGDNSAHIVAAAAPGGAVGRGDGRGGGKGEDGKSEDGATGDGGERVMDGGVTGEANANTNTATLSYPFVLHQSHLCEMMLRLSKAETERSLKCAGLWTLSGLLQQEMATVNNGSFHVEDHTKACDALTLPMVMSVSSLRVRLLRYCETQVCESIIFHTPFIHPL